MTTLHDLIPDPKSVIALEPEELAGIAHSLDGILLRQTTAAYGFMIFITKPVLI